MLVTIILLLSSVYYPHQSPNTGFKAGHKRVNTDTHRYICAAGILQPDNSNFLIHTSPSFPGHGDQRINSYEIFPPIKAIPGISPFLLIHGCADSLRKGVGPPQGLVPMPLSKGPWLGFACGENKRRTDHTRNSTGISIFLLPAYLPSHLWPPLLPVSASFRTYVKVWKPSVLVLSWEWTVHTFH